MGSIPSFHISSIRATHISAHFLGNYHIHQFYCLFALVYSLVANMRLTWSRNAWGRKVYDFLDSRDRSGVSQLALEYHDLGAETYYLLFGVRNEIRRCILEFRVPDTMWQDRQPRLLEE
jgi:hypothetical protein